MEGLEARRFLSAVALGAAVAATPLTASAGLSVQFASQGISQLSYNGTTLFNAASNPAGVFSIVEYNENKSGTNTLYWGSPGNNYKTSWNASAQMLTCTLDFGTVAVQYAGSGNTVGMTITVTNTTVGTTVEGLCLSGLTLTFPQEPAGFTGGSPINYGNEGPGVMLADYGKGVVAMTDADPGRQLYSGFNTNGPLSANNSYEAWIASAPLLGQPPAWPTLTEPIAPNSSQVYHVSLRFGPEGSTAASLAQDVLNAYAAANPSQVNWTDKRPIAMLFPAGSGPSARSATNPRGWFNDPNVNVTTPAGLANFAQRLMSWANGDIQTMKQMGAQGMITWDIEGEQYTDATYIGDPRLATTLAPELAYNNVVNQYFQAFRNAGFETGVTIREQELIWNNGNPYQEMVPPATEVQTLVSKINYAETNWGCTLFYIDSTNWADSPSILQQVHQQCPGVLLIPENSNTGMYAYAAPFAQLRPGKTNVAVTPEAQATYSGAFRVIDTTPVDIGNLQQQLVQDVKDGDILMFGGVGFNRQNLLVSQIYRQAGKPLVNQLKVGAAAPSVMPDAAVFSTTPISEAAPQAFVQSLLQQLKNALGK